MAASHSSVAVSSSHAGNSVVGGGHMLATSSSMGNVYNGSTHANRDFINHETAAHSNTSSSGNHKGVSGSSSGLGQRVITTNSPCLNNFLFPILTDVS